MTNVVALNIVESAVLDRKVVRGVERARGSNRTKYKFVRHLGGNRIHQIWTAQFSTYLCHIFYH